MLVVKLREFMKFPPKKIIQGYAADCIIVSKILNKNFECEKQ